jgi:flagellar biosynthesis protein FlhA
MRRFREVFDATAAESPVLLTSPAIRAPVRAVIERIRPATPVMSQAEISPRAKIRTVGAI